MTKLIIDLSDVAGGTHPDDNVVVWSPVHREGSAGRTVSPTQHTIRLTEGKGEREVEPGPLMVQTHVRAIADTRPKEVVVPDQDSVTLWDLLEQVFQWTPPLVNRALQAIIDALEDALNQVDGAVAAEVDAIKWSKTTTYLQIGVDLETLREGWHSFNPAFAEAYDFPKASGFSPATWTSGFLMQIKRQSDVNQILVIGKHFPELWARGRTSSGFMPWKRLSISPDDIPDAIEVGGYVADANIELSTTSSVTDGNTKNIPVASVGALLTLPNAADGTVMQYFSSRGVVPEIYVRSYSTNEIWFEWQKVFPADMPDISAWLVPYVTRTELTDEIGQAMTSVVGLDPDGVPYMIAGGV